MRRCEGCRGMKRAETCSGQRHNAWQTREGRARKEGLPQRVYWRHAPRARSGHMWRPRVGAQGETTRSKTEKGAGYALRWGGPVRPVDVVFYEPTMRAVGRCLDSAAAEDPGRGKPQNSHSKSKPTLVLPPPPTAPAASPPSVASSFPARRLFPALLLTGAAAAAGAALSGRSIQRCSIIARHPRRRGVSTRHAIDAATRDETATRCFSHVFPASLPAPSSSDRNFVITGVCTMMITGACTGACTVDHHGDHHCKHRCMHHSPFSFVEHRTFSPCKIMTS